MPSLEGALARARHGRCTSTLTPKETMMKITLSSLTNAGAAAFGCTVPQSPTDNLASTLVDESSAGAANDRRVEIVVAPRA
jgi:hypothetical protein